MGFFDCSSAPKMVYGATSDDYIAFVKDYLLKVGGVSKNAVPVALREAHHDMHSRPVLKGGELYKEKHGWLDGEWWGDAQHGNPEEKLGYVEGYLSCEFGTATAHETHQYVNALNRHFAIEANEHDKIANVLQPILEREKTKS